MLQAEIPFPMHINGTTPIIQNDRFKRDTNQRDYFI